jgi:hypothetical protein
MTVMKMATTTMVVMDLRLLVFLHAHAHFQGKTAALADVADDGGLNCLDPGVPWQEGRKDGRKEGRKEGRTEGRKEGWKEDGGREGMVGGGREGRKE